MRIGILSDTHDNLPKIREALSFFASRGARVLIHAGDFGAPFALKEVLEFEGPVHAVLGNNDGEREGLRKLLPRLDAAPLRLQISGRTLLVAHEEKALTQSNRAGVDVVVVGHTHRAEIRPGEPMLLNPGECGGWLTGVCTVMTLETDTLEVHIHELGKT